VRICSPVTCTGKKTRHPTIFLPNNDFVKVFRFYTIAAISLYCLVTTGTAGDVVHFAQFFFSLFHTSFLIAKQPKGLAAVNNTYTLLERARV